MFFKSEISITNNLNFNHVNINIIIILSSINLSWCEKNQHLSYHFISKPPNYKLYYSSKHTEFSMFKFSVLKINNNNNSSNNNSTAPSHILWSRQINNNVENSNLKAATFNGSTGRVPMWHGEQVPYLFIYFFLVSIVE